MMASESLSADAVRQLVETELSLRSRLRYVALLLGALTMTAVIGSLWLTEPVLPMRTRVAFGVMTGIGLSWAAFGVWVLTHRRPLLAPHGIVAGRMAVTFTAAFVLGSLLVGWQTGTRAPHAAAAFGGLMLVVAVVVLRRAHREFARLTERRRMLAREIGLATE
jgi:hypothetical protein